MEPTDMDTQDKQAALTTLDSAEIDEAFIPYLERINQLPFAATKQCCVGHLEYKNPNLSRPAGNTGRWGYLQLLVAQEAAEWLMTVADRWEWLWVEGSQFWLERGRGARDDRARVNPDCLCVGCTLLAPTG
jgi:hypothetical protein